MKPLLLCGMLSVTLLAGCQTMDRRDVSTGVGAVVGGVVGNQFGQGSGRTAATILGATVGAFVGSRIGTSMDARDRGQLGYSLEHSPSGSSKSWVNPDTGNRYTVTPDPAYHDASGKVCREFSQTGSIDGHQERLRGLACRDGNGTWRIVNVY